MTDKEKKYLSDVLSSIELIEEFTSDLTSFTDYSKDLKTQSAVERHLGIIGEAVNKFLKASEENTLKSAKQIISLRNRLIHTYDKIDNSIIWAIIKRHLDGLKKEVKEMMGAVK